MSTAAKGRLAEHRARDILRAAGYTVTRAAGSKGAADLIAWSRQGTRFIQVKGSGCYLSAVEREALMSGEWPPNSTVECWRFVPGDSTPRIEVLR